MPKSAKHQKRTAPAASALRRSRLINWIAGVVVLGMVATVAVISAGFDAAEAPRQEASVWAIKGGGSGTGQYGRVNTLTGEIDAVRQVENSTGLLQQGSNTVVLARGKGWGIDPTGPHDLVDEKSAGAGKASGAQQGSPSADPGSGGAESPSVDLPPGVVGDPISAGDAVLFRTEEGRAYLSRLTDAASGGAASASTLSSGQELDPLAEERAQADPKAAEKLQFFVDAAAMDENGEVALYSADAHEVRWYSGTRGAFTRTDEVQKIDLGEDARKAVQLAIVAGSWVLFDSTTGRLWRGGSADRPIATGVDQGGRLQASSTAAAGDEVLVAGPGGLWRSSTKRIEAQQQSAIPAQPMAVGATRFAGWVASAGEVSAVLWTLSEPGAKPETKQLEADATAKPEQGDRKAVFRSSGTSSLLTEQASGTMWLVPDGRLISAAQWGMDETAEQPQKTETKEPKDQLPPVAVDDEFGVRAGEPTLLPVLLNDYDPNQKDVLTLDTKSVVTEIPGLGSISVLPDAQSLVFRADSKPSRTGGTFTYAITDGTGLSNKATVRLAVIDAGQNRAPQWCDKAVKGCQLDWPQPQLAPGGSLVMPALEGWVDPDGDPLVLKGATSLDKTVDALVTTDGRLALRHKDANLPGGTATIELQIADSSGMTASRNLAVQVRKDAQATLAPSAATVAVGESVELHPLEQATGGSGSFALLDATAEGSKLEITPNKTTGTVTVRGKEAGSTVITVTFVDNGTGKEGVPGVMRVTAAPPQPLALPPLRAFVREDSDATVDLLAAIPGSAGRALTVSSAVPVPLSGASLRADVLEGSKLRISGGTPSGAPGRIGAVDVTITDFDAQGKATSFTGRVTVYQVDTVSAAPIAVDDVARVRVGEVVDIAVLENDIAPPGQHLVLSPDVKMAGKGSAAGTAFASGNVLRFLAPGKKGSYELDYQTYGVSEPQKFAVGRVRIEVLPAITNAAPRPAPLTVRLARGGSGTVQVPLSGIDPDGDRVRLIGASDGSAKGLVAAALPGSATIRVTAADDAQLGANELTYTVADAKTQSVGVLRVIVTKADESSQRPVTYSDYVRVPQNAAKPVVIRPLDNDIDPSGGALRIAGDVEPNLAKSSPSYAVQQGRLAGSKLQQGRVEVSGNDQLGASSFTYRAISDTSKSEASGLIVVEVSEEIGRQAPAVQDTLLSAQDWKKLAGGGVDVVTGRVSWASGDIDALKLDIVGSDKAKFRTDGKRSISSIGEADKQGGRVMFKLSGKDLAGTDVQTYGFLTIPSYDDLRLTLKPGVQALKAKEGGPPATSKLTELIELAAGDQAVFDTAAPFAVQRSAARCQAGDGGARLSYTAGEGAPWSDNCLVRVRLKDQSPGAWTVLAVPVDVEPKDPTPLLKPRERTVTQGAAETIDLTEMVEWAGNRQGDLKDLVFSTVNPGPPFTVVSSNGPIVEVRAAATAAPNEQARMRVTVTGKAGKSSTADYTFTVRENRARLKAGTPAAQECTVGKACSVRVLGLPDEEDPFRGDPGGGITLTGAQSDGACARDFGVLAARGDSVALGWGGSAKTGGVCRGTFTVKSGNKVATGSVTINVKGKPIAPSSVAATGAGGSSVTLTVTMSGERSEPAVERVELLSGSSTVGKCGAYPGEGGQVECVVSGLTPGKANAKTYTARTVNAVGDSETSAASQPTWAYQAPTAPTIESDGPQVWKDNGDPSKGRVRVRIGKAPGNAETVLTIDGDSRQPENNGIYVLKAGQAHTFSVSSKDPDDEAPPGYNGEKQGASNTATATPIGAPQVSGPTLTFSGAESTDWTLSDGTTVGDNLTISYGFKQGLTVSACSPSVQSSGSVGGGGGKWKMYTGLVCVQNDYGRAQAATEPSWAGGDLPLPGGGTVTYTVGGSGNSAPGDAGGSYSYTANAPHYTGLVGSLVYENTGNSTFSVTPDAPETRVKQCKDDHCSDWSTVTAQALKPLEVRLSACVTTQNAQSADIAQSISLIGDPGGTPDYATSGNDIVVTWQGNVRNSFRFSGGYCPA